MATEEPLPGLAPAGTQDVGLEDMIRGLVSQDLGISQQIPNNIRNLVQQDLQQQGYEVVGEVPSREEYEKEQLLQEEERKWKHFEGQQAVKGFMEEPGFMQQVKDLSMLAQEEQRRGWKDPTFFSMAAESLLSGLTLRNQEHVINLAGDVAGVPDLYKKFKDWQTKGFKKKLGYVPSPEVTAFVEAPHEVAAVFAPIGKILQGASIPAKALTKIPALQRLARGVIGGAAVGMAAKPEEEGFWNRVKQIPASVLFFTAFEGLFLGAEQIARIANYNRAMKYYKKVNWDAPQVPPGGKPFTAKQMQDLYRKMDRNSAGAGLEMTAEELEILETMKHEGGWNEAVRRGYIKPRAEWMTTGEPAVKPRKPRWGDIFREKVPVTEAPMPEVRPEPEVPPAEAPPPPRPEAPAPAREVRPPIGEVAPTEAPLARRPSVTGEVPPEAPPPTISVNVSPTAEGGWKIDLPQPPIEAPAGWAQPAPNIPWRPVEPEVAPPRKKPVFKNPFYEAVNQLGGVAPNPDYPHASLKEIFPPGLIRKAGMPMDTLAQAMAHEFPAIEGDVDLWDYADRIRRGRAVFKDERTGDEHYPPREEVEAEYQAWKDRKPAEMTRTEFRKEVKVAIKDTSTGEVHPAKEGEIIHADVFSRLTDRGMKADDMEAGFVFLRDGQFIFSYSLKKVKPGEPPKPAPKYDSMTFHRELVREALEKGEHIPPEALKQHKIDYPELFEEKVAFTKGDTVDYDTITGMRTGEITKINQKEGIASIRDEQGIVTTRNLEDLRLSKEPLAEKFVTEEGVELGRYERREPLAPEERVEREKLKEPYRQFLKDYYKGKEVPAKKIEEKATAYENAVEKYPELPEVLDDLGIPKLKRAAIADQVIRNYDPDKAPLRNYVKSIRKWVTEEGELRERVTKKKAIKPTALTTEMEEVVPGEAERPEDIFERAQEEIRVKKIFKANSKSEQQADILDRKILKGQSFADIGKEHGFSKQRAEQLFKEAFEKVKADPEVQKMVERKMLQANLGPIPSARDIDDMVKYIKKYFWSTKGVDKVIDEVNDKRLGSILAEIFDATPEAKVVKKFLKEYSNDALDAMVLSAIKGEIPVGGSALPDEIIDAIGTMRERMDRLSQLIMTHGGLTRQTEAAFESFLGRYIGKFYRLHQQRRWDPPKEVKDRFKAMLRRNYPGRYGDFTEQELDNLVEGIINEERKFGFAQKKAKRVPTGHFKRQLRLSQEWRDLAGEYLDPVYLYLKTISTQATMAYNAEFINMIKQTYPDMWVTNTTDAERVGWQKYRLPDNYGYGKLRNKYVHPELYNYITHEVDPAVSGIEKVIMKFITNPFKATKTIGSMPTQGRNLLTNFALSLLNENLILNPLNFPYYARATAVFVGRHKKFQKEWARLLKENVTGVQYYGTEIPKIQSDLMRVDPLNWGEKIWKIMTAPAKFGVRKLGGLYNFNDALFRIATFYKRTEKFEETPKQAVAELDRSLQNYRKLPVVVDILRRYPVFGPFISFRWNLAKIMVNQAVQAGKETGAPKGSKTWWKGTKRWLRLGFFLGLPAIMSKVFQEVFDVDEEKIEKLEAFLPKYRQNGMFLYFRGKEGQLKALDLTYLYPTGDIQRAIKSLSKGDVETFKDAIDLFAHPIFDAWSILIEGRQPYWGTKVPGGFMGRMAEILKLLWIPASAPIPSMKSLTESIKAGKFEPRAGALTGYQMKAMIDAWNQEPDRYGRFRNLSEEVKTFFTGLKTWNVEPDKLLLQYSRQKKAEAMELKRELLSWAARNTKAPAWEIADKKKKFKEQYDKLIKEATEASQLYSDLSEGGFLVKAEK